MAGIGLVLGMGLISRLRLGVGMSQSQGFWGLGGETWNPKHTLSGRSQCSRCGWGSEGSGCPLQWPSTE